MDQLLFLFISFLYVHFLYIRVLYFICLHPFFIRFIQNLLLQPSIKKNYFYTQNMAHYLTHAAHYLTQYGQD